MSPHARDAKILLVLLALFVLLGLLGRAMNFVLGWLDSDPVLWA